MSEENSGMAQEPLWRRAGVVLHAVVASFVAYFAMYAFRKPFSAATFEGVTWWGGLGLKEVLVASQVAGYALSKFVGIGVCAALKHRWREGFLLGLILLAELALWVYGVVPNEVKCVPIAFNGLALGMVWGLVVSYLEGRKVSEVLLAGLSCSFIVSSGIVKDVGRAVLCGEQLEWWQGTPWLSQSLSGGEAVSEGWMPFVVGLHYLPLFVAAVALLRLLAKPTKLDIVERVERVPMAKEDRKAFFQSYGSGLLMLCGVYFLVTIYRDFRDNFQVDLVQQMGYGDRLNVLGDSETIVAFAVLASLCLLYILRRKWLRAGLLLVWGFMALGVVVLAGATLAYQMGVLDGFWWMVCTGVGTYMIYVPFGSVLFDQLMASLRTRGNAIYAIYVADAVGYAGVMLFLLTKDVLFGGMSSLQVLQSLSWGLVLVSALGFVWTYRFFKRASAR